MINRTLRLFRSFGSILDIAPETRYEQFIPRESFNERLRLSFERTGLAIRHAMDVKTDEQGTQENREPASPFKV